MMSLGTLLAVSLLAQRADSPWQKPESPYLKNVKQLTADFVRAGEAYFSPDGKQVVFQAEEKERDNPFYQIYVMDLATKRTRRLSPGMGKTTCSYFTPDGRQILYASSHLDPNAKKKQGEEYKLREEEASKGIRRRYRWDFDEHMDLFLGSADGSGKLRRLTNSPGYDAEGSFSPDGKEIVFCSNRSGEKNLELHIMEVESGKVRQLTRAPGCYNGGPFFSPDGKRVIFRADREKPDHLQLYVINSDGTGERQLTRDLDWVQWGPYWYGDSKHIIYAAADHSNPAQRPNYDLYWMNIDTGKKTRITFFPGADVLPVFSPDGKKMMWTSTRGDGRSSQLWIADFVAPKE